MSKHKKNKKTETLVHFILDQSGSMEDIKSATLKGFNSYLSELKLSKNPIRFSLTLFNSTYIITPYTNISVKEVPPLTEETYKPVFGTPLYDAVVNSVEALHEKIGNKKMAVIVAIMTDGEENSSTQHDAGCLRELVEKLQSKGNWTFTYMGANQDAWENARVLGISKGNTMNWKADDRGATNAFKSYSRGTVMMANAAADGLSMRSSSFFDTKGDETDVT